MKQNLPDQMLHQMKIWEGVIRDNKELFDKEMGFKDRVQAAAEGQFAENLKVIERQFFEDQRVNDFNMKMAEKMFNKKDMSSNIGSLWDENVAKQAGSIWSGDR